MMSIPAIAWDHHAGSGCADVHAKPHPGVDYQAGVSASGEQVASADTAPPLMPGEAFARTFVDTPPPINDPSGNAQFPGNQYGEVEVGALRGDGSDKRVFYNGVDLTPLERSEYDPDCQR